MILYIKDFLNTFCVYNEAIVYRQNTFIYINVSHINTQHGSTSHGHVQAVQDHKTCKHSCIKVCVK